MVKLVIEHLDRRVYKWSLLEYSHISSFSGPKNTIFTNIKGKKDTELLTGLGKIYTGKAIDLKFKNACVLDPGAKETLRPDEHFDYLILGGILGDFPPRKRTKKELTDVLGLPARNLGHNQMSTNTAAYVAWKIAHGTRLEDLKFKRRLVIPTGQGQEVILPYKYVIEDGKLVLPDGYIEMAKKQF